MPKSWSPTIQKNIASLKKIVPAQKWELRTANQQLSYVIASGSDLTPCIKISKPLTTIDLHTLVMICIDGHNNFVFIWQNLSVFTQKHDFKVVLWSDDK